MKIHFGSNKYQNIPSTPSLFPLIIVESSARSAAGDLRHTAARVPRRRRLRPVAGLWPAIPEAAADAVPALSDQAESRRRGRTARPSGRSGGANAAGGTHQRAGGQVAGEFLVIVLHLEIRLRIYRVGFYCSWTCRVGFNLGEIDLPFLLHIC